MRNHKLLYASSYLQMCRNMLHNTVNERISLSSLWSLIHGLSKSARDSWKKVLLLWKEVQVRVEQISPRFLEGQKDTLLLKTKQKHTSRQEPKLERWTQSRQERIYSYLSSLTSSCRWRWICKRAQVSSGGTSWSNTRAQGGSASC